MTNLEITEFEIGLSQNLNIIAQYIPQGKWSSKPSIVLTINTSNGDMLILNFNSKKTSQMIVDILDKLNHESYQQKDKIHLCVNDK